MRREASTDAGQTARLALRRRIPPRRVPTRYLGLLMVGLLISLLILRFPSVEALRWGVAFCAGAGLYILAHDCLIMWRRGGVVGRLTINFGIVYWFWLGALESAFAKPPFPTPDRLYPGFSSLVPEQVVAVGLVGVNVFALTAMLGWRFVPQPTRLLRRLADRMDPQPSRWLDLVTLGLALLAWVPQFIAYQGDLGAAVGDMLRMRGGEYVGAEQSAGLFHHLYLLSLFGAALALARIVLQAPGYLVARYVAVALVVPMVYLGAGSRFNFGYLLLPALLILMAPALHTHKWDSRRWTLVAMVVLGGALLLYQGAVRDVGFGGNPATQHASIGIGQTLAAGWVGHDQFGALLIAIDLVENQTGFFREPMAPYFITHFVPQQFWPEKPYPVSWTTFNAAWTQGYGFNVTPSIIGQYYLNWGFFGIVYIGFFIGWLARFTELWFARLTIRWQWMSATVAGFLLAFVFLSFRMFYPLYFAYPLVGCLAYLFLTRKRRWLPLPRR
jgi:oligosaccharide repeat unit polymerase